MSLIMIFLFGVIIIIVCKFFVNFYKFIKFANTVNKIPGPFFYPFPGLFFSGLNVKTEDRLQWFIDIMTKFENGIVLVTSALSEALVVLCKPRHVEAIFASNENITKSFVYDILDPWLGKALLTSTGVDWHRQRKFITPAFHFGIVNQFFDVISEKAAILNEIIAEKINENPEKPIEFYELSTRCTLDIICETAMGINMDVQRNHDSVYSSALQTAAEIFTKRLRYPWLQWDWIFYRTTLGSQFKSSIETMIDYTTKVIKKRKEARRMLKLSENNEAEQKRKAFLDLLLDLNDSQTVPITETELRQQVETFMFAGHDTTSTGISWIIFVLGNRPDIQDKVIQEIDQVFGDSKEPATPNQIAELKYLERVIKETFRLYPPVPGIGRRLTEDVMIDGYLIPKGCNISISILLLHRDPEIWENPLEYDPDRFLPENSRGRHPYAFVPFSAGPRNCIGQKFAMKEEKIILATILRKWKIKSAISIKNMKMRSTFVLRSHNGIPVYFTPR